MDIEMIHNVTQTILWYGFAPLFFPGVVMIFFSMILEKFDLSCAKTIGYLGTIIMTLAFFAIVIIVAVIIILPVANILALY